MTKTPDITLKIVEPEHRGDSFYALMGRFFMDNDVRKEMPYLKDEDDKVWVLAFDGKTCVGFSALRTIPKGHELCSLYVVPEYRRTGVARIMIESRLDWTSRDPLVRVVCNADTLPIYLELGFKKVAMRGKAYTVVERKGASVEKGSKNSHRHIGGSILPSHDWQVLEPKIGEHGRFETRVLEEEDTHVLLFFPNGSDDPLTVAKHPNGFTCDLMAKLTIKAWETQAQDDIAKAFDHRDYVIAVRGREVLPVDVFYHFVMSEDIDSGR